MNMDDKAYNAFYEYRDGIIAEIEMQAVSTVINSQGKEYEVELLYGFRNNGEFFAVNNSKLYSDLDYDGNRMWVSAVPGRTDVVYMELWTNNGWEPIIINNTVLFNLETFEVTDMGLDSPYHLHPNPDLLMQRNDEVIDDWDYYWDNWERTRWDFTDQVTGEVYTIPDMRFGYLTPDREWLAYTVNFRFSELVADGVYELVERCLNTRPPPYAHRQTI
jgi:hypothetical protein